MNMQRNAAPSLGKLPEDPAAFVAEAERITQPKTAVTLLREQHRIGIKPLGER